MGYARPDHEAYGALQLTDASRPVLKGELKVEMRRVVVRKVKAEKPRRGVAAGSVFFDPKAPVVVISSGSERYLPGVPVTLRAVSGHRDTGQTSCPGDTLYAQPDGIASKTFATGPPQILEP